VSAVLFDADFVKKIETAPHWRRKDSWTKA